MRERMKRMRRKKWLCRSSYLQASCGTMMDYGPSIGSMTLKWQPRRQSYWRCVTVHSAQIRMTRRLKSRLRKPDCRNSLPKRFRSGLIRLEMAWSKTEMLTMTSSCGIILLGRWSWGGRTRWVRRYHISWISLIEICCLRRRTIW